MPTHIAIIIPVHNGLEYTKRCLDGLCRLAVEASSFDWQFEVVVVDDGSTDGTGEWVGSNHKAVHLLRGDGNLWWSGGIKKGMQFALHTLRADYVLWWNNDIYPAEDYFESLKTIINDDDQNSVYGSKVYQAEAPDTVWAFGGFFHRVWGHSYLRGQGIQDDGRFSQPLEADWLPGMGTLLSANVMKKTGSVNDKDFPQYHGDVDYTFRAKLAGCKILVHPALRIWNYTAHSAHVTASPGRGRLKALLDTRSQHHLHKEWLLYRKYVRNPLAYLVLVKKYGGVIWREIRRTKK